jgi:hypothetical protein
MTEIPPTPEALAVQARGTRRRSLLRARDLLRLYHISAFWHRTPVLGIGGYRQFRREAAGSPDAIAGEFLSRLNYDRALPLLSR